MGHLLHLQSRSIIAFACLHGPYLNKFIAIPPVGLLAPCEGKHASRRTPWPPGRLDLGQQKYSLLNFGEGFVFRSFVNT